MNNFTVVFVFLCLTIVCYVTAERSAEDEECDNKWEEFKKKFNKKYSNEAEETKKKKTFKDNFRRIKKHNKEADEGKHSYKVDTNAISDLSSDELRKFRKGYNGIKGRQKSNRTFIKTRANVPASVDYRNSGLVTPVKDQGQCGSCWAFSSTGSLEACNAKKTGKLVSLSEQNLVDCVTKNGGCNGGWMDYAFQYVQQKGNINTETSYPYKAKQGTCAYNANNIGGKCSGYVDIQSGSESALQQAVATVGPISFAMDASLDSFQSYKSGVYGPSGCSTTNLDHAMLIVGYNTQSNPPYWIIKNSWGTSWGMQGYMYLRMNQNMCGVATAASYPTC